MAKARQETEPMPRLALQAVGPRNYKATLEQGVPLDRIARFLTADEARRLRQLFPQRTAAVWGLMPDNVGSAEVKWAKISEGDLVLFSGGGEIISMGTVAHKTRNRALAADLWGTVANGRTWELIYFLGNLTPIGLPYRDFNAIAGYKATFHVQTMFYLPDEKARSILSVLRDRDLIARRYEAEEGAT